jgi:hypothetical protein
VGLNSSVIFSLLCFPGVMYNCVLYVFVAPYTCMCMCGRMHGGFYSQLNVV